MTKKSNKRQKAAEPSSSDNLINIPKLPEKEIVTKECWFFSQSNDRLRFGDNRLCEVGVTHTTENKTSLCEHGLHGSPTVWDALNYAPGDTLWRVQLDGVEQYVKEGDRALYTFGREDKYVGTSRTYLAKVNARDYLFDYTRKLILKNVEQRMADGMKFNPIVLDYLKTSEDWQNALDNMVAVDLSNKKERQCYDWVWYLVNLQSAGQLHGIGQSLRSLITWIDGRSSSWDFYYPRVEIYKDFDEHFLKEMGLADKAV